MVRSSGMERRVAAGGRGGGRAASAVRPRRWRRDNAPHSGPAWRPPCPTMQATLRNAARRSPALARAATGATTNPPPPTSRLADADLIAADGVRVDAYDGDGFDVSGGLRVDGAALLASPAFAARWARVSSLADITPSSLALATVLKPPPDLVIVGTGRIGARLPAATLAALASRASIEALPTPKAAALFNVLAGEGRAVVAALLPAGWEEEG